MSSTDPTFVGTPAAPAGAAARGRWARLPDPIDQADLVESVAASDARDPDLGRDPDRDWMLRHA